MTLNDDVEDGLDGLEDIVEPADTNPDAPVPPKIVLANKTDAATPEDNDINHVPVTRLFGTPIVPGELPNLDADFLITAEINNKASDIASIQTTLRGQCAMCQEDALAVDSVVPGFISDSRPLGYFTENKTPTQLSQTMASLDNALDLQLVELKEASLKMTEKLVPAFRDMAQAAQLNIQTSLVKYQFALSEIALGNVNRSNDDPTRILLTELDRNVPRFYEPDDKPSSFGGFQAFFKEVACLGSRRDNHSNLSNICYRYREDVKQNAFCFDGVVYVFTEAEPYVALAGKEIASTFDNSVSFSDVLYNGVDMVSINYLQGLINLSVSYTEALVRSAALMEEACKKPDLTPKQRLDYMTQIVSINNTYAKQSINIFGFINDYFALYDSIIGTVLDVHSKNRSVEISTGSISKGT